MVAPRSPVKRIFAALSAFDVADRPMTRLDAARRLREAAEELEATQVEAARKAGATWMEIGACYGLTKQGAQQRFRAARNEAKAVTAAPRSKKAEPVALPAGRARSGTLGVRGGRILKARAVRRSRIGAVFPGQPPTHGHASEPLREPSRRASTGRPSLTTTTRVSVRASAVIRSACRENRSVAPTMKQGYTGRTTFVADLPEVRCAICRYPNGRLADSRLATLPLRDWHLAVLGRPRPQGPYVRRMSRLSEAATDSGPLRLGSMRDLTPSGRSGCCLSSGKYNLGDLGADLVQGAVGSIPGDLIGKRRTMGHDLGLGDPVP